MSYVYIQSEPPGVDSDGLYTVGFYAPDGTWEPESDHGKRERAADRVHWLNGGRRFDRTHCSQCGGEFGPGDEGYSRCADHAKEAKA